MINIDLIVAITNILSNLATFLGIPLVIIVYIRDRQQARQTREQDTYRLLQEEYSSFLKLCLDYPELQLHDYQPQMNIELSPEQKKRQIIAFEILTSMFESAYYFYNLGHSTEFKKRQWTGWEQFIIYWCGRKDFREAWKEHLGDQFDKEFISYVNKLVDERITG